MISFLTYPKRYLDIFIYHMKYGIIQIMNIKYVMTIKVKMIHVVIHVLHLSVVRSMII